MSVLSLSYQESEVTITNISQRLPHIMAGKQLAQAWCEDITSLSPYVLWCWARYYITVTLYIVVVGHCDSKFTCGKNSRQCYTAQQRCDGINNCDHRTDELHCCKFITQLILLYTVVQKRLCTVLKTVRFSKVLYRVGEKKQGHFDFLKQLSQKLTDFSNF